MDWLPAEVLSEDEWINRAQWINPLMRSEFDALLGGARNRRCGLSN